MRAGEPLVAAGALLAVLVALAAARAGRRAARRAAALHGALGDAVVVLDRSGAIVHANAAAGRLAGIAPAALRGRPIAALGEDLRVLARGLERGPAVALVEVSAGGASLRARASLARIASRPARDLVVLRPEPVERPPPLPARGPGPPPSGPAGAAAAEARAGILAVAAAVAEPLARAARAASLLRLSAPPLPARAAAALAALEQALEEAERRASALAAAGQPGRGRPLDLSALVDELVRAAAAPPGARIRCELSAARALADERPLRAALREVIRSAAAPLRAGEELVVSVRGDAGGAAVVLAAPGAGGLEAPLARALLAPHGALVDEQAGAAGWRLRVVLPAAAAEALAGA